VTDDDPIARLRLTATTNIVGGDVTVDQDDLLVLVEAYDEVRGRLEAAEKTARVQTATATAAKIERDTWARVAADYAAEKALPDAQAGLDVLLQKAREEGILP
jgi:hypothetical protein